MKLEIWTDGTSRPKMFYKKNKGKDGPSSGAIIIKQNDDVIYKEAFYAGIIDNNQAEYLAFIKAVEYVLTLEAEHVCFYTDSNLIEKQMNLKYSAHKESIIPFYEKAKEVLQKLKSWEVNWVSRKENREADQLADEFMKQWSVENILNDI